MTEAVSTNYSPIKLASDVLELQEYVKRITMSGADPEAMALLQQKVDRLYRITVGGAEDSGIENENEPTAQTIFDDEQHPWSLYKSIYGNAAQDGQGFYRETAIQCQTGEAAPLMQALFGVPQLEVDEDSGTVTPYDDQAIAFLRAFGMGGFQQQSVIDQMIGDSIVIRNSQRQIVKNAANYHQGAGGDGGGYFGSDTFFTAVFGRNPGGSINQPGLDMENSINQRLARVEQRVDSIISYLNGGGVPPT